MDVEFRDEYTHRTNDELLRLWMQRDTLVPEARDALAVELHSRPIDLPTELKRMEARCKREERRQWREQARAIRKGYQQGAYGRIGRANYTFNRNSGHEEFDSTVFFFVAGFPLFPIRAYRIQKSPKTERERILCEVPITWPHVYELWAKAAFYGALVFLAVVIALEIWVRRYR